MKTQIELLKELKIPIRGHLGQHLLIDGNIQKKIVELLDFNQQGNRFVEIGPGLGALTGHILERGARLTVVEKDPRLADALKTIFSEALGQRQLHVKLADVLDVDFEELLDQPKQGACQVISNLPYYITGPILAKILPLKIFGRAVFMMQQEVADRIFAEPGTREYGRLSLLVRFYSEARHAFDVSPGCFTPPPEVNSSVVVLKFHNILKNQDIDEKLLLDLVKAAFSQRRKKLVSSLSQSRFQDIPRDVWLERFKQTRISPDVRPEDLGPEDYMALAKAISRP